MKKNRIIIAVIAAVLVILAICVALWAISVKRGHEEAEKNIGSRIIDSENGTRYADFLVLYTEDTERNKYGYELLVEKSSGFVIDADLLVDMTEDTYVLSGHGTAADFLRLAEVGDMVEIKGNSLEITRSLVKSSLKKIELYRAEVDEVAEYRLENLYDIDKDALRQAEKEIKKEIIGFKAYLYTTPNPDEKEVESRLRRVLRVIDRKYYLTAESRAVEGRGLWHRPGRSGIAEYDLAGVEAFADQLDKLGINALYVETFWHGLTTYDSRVICLQHPAMAKGDYGEYGNDYMLALISECHKRGIEVHAWFEVLNAGVAGRSPAPYVKAEWLYTDLTGDSSDNYFDPTNPEVQALLLDLVEEMLIKYDFDGISYDYIRYTETGEYGGYIDSGFSKNSIALFKEKYGYSGENLTEDLKNDTSLRAEWHKFKQDAITDLVKKMSDHIRSIDPDAIISASPYGYIEDAKAIYMQDIDAWLKAGCLDVVLPMIYTEDVKLLSDTAALYEKYSDTVLQYTGISPLYNGADLRTNQDLTEAVREMGISGVSFFASQNYITRSSEYNEIILSVLSSSTHRGNALTPTSAPDAVFKAWKAEFLDRCHRIYEKELTKDEILTIKKFDEATSAPLQSAEDIEKAIDLLLDFRAEAESFECDAARARICEQIDYICHILKCAAARGRARI